MGRGRDRNLDTLLDLDGQVLIVDPEGRFWVKFVVKRVSPSPEKPHGLDYSLTLHDETGKRIVGFDNAHPVRGSGPGGRRWTPHDHRHRRTRMQTYAYSDPVALLTDFWMEVDAVLKEEGIIP